MTIAHCMKENTNMSRSKEHVLWAFYSYLTRIGFLLIDLVPPLIRTIVFKLHFHSFGKGSLLDYGSYYQYGKKIYFGKNARLGKDCTLRPSYWEKDSVIVFEDNVVVGSQCSFVATGHDISKSDLPMFGGAIIVKKGAYLGLNVTVVAPDVRKRGPLIIGEGAVIGAGAVVTKSIEPFTVAAGVPARVIGRRPIEEKDM